MVDGQHLSRGVAQMKKYVVSEAPALLPEAVEDPVAFLICSGIGIAFFDAIVSDDVYEQWTDDAGEIHDLGNETLDDHECRHVRWEQGDSHWELWIDAGTAPVVRKVAIRPRGQEDAEQKNAVVYHLRDWEFDPQFSATEFVYQPPAGAEQVDQIFPGAKTDFTYKSGTLTKLGAAAPNITIAPLGRPAFPLADQRGRVVVVNFFATWCQPCLKELPKLEKLWSELHSNDQFCMFVIGREESPEAVAEFQNKFGFHFEMAADPDRQAFNRFAVESIPRTYLIDRDGKIIYQCTGYDPKEFRKLRAMLQKELGNR